MQLDALLPALELHHGAPGYTDTVRELGLSKSLLLADACQRGTEAEVDLLHAREATTMGRMTLSLTVTISDSLVVSGCSATLGHSEPKEEVMYGEGT
jgi:hypothetical protein